MNRRMTAAVMLAALGIDLYPGPRDEMPPPPLPSTPPPPPPPEETLDPVARAASRFRDVDDLNRAVSRVEAAIGKRARKAARRLELAERARGGK